MERWRKGRDGREMVTRWRGEREVDIIEGREGREGGGDEMEGGERCDEWRRGGGMGRGRESEDGEHSVHWRFHLLDGSE